MIIKSNVNKKFKEVRLAQAAVILFVTFTILAAIMCLSACSLTQQTENSDASFTVTDLCDRQVSFNKPAQRVVALTASDCEVLYAINAGDTIIARGTYCDYPESVKDVQDVGSGTLTSIESIIAMKPDCVFMSKMNQTTAQVDSLVNAGIKVVVNEPTTIEQTYRYIEILGQVVGHESDASQVIDNMKSTFTDIKSNVASANNDSIKKVYFEVSPLQYGLWTAGTDTFMQEICEILGMRNAFDDVSGWSEISQEQVISRNPDVIIAVTMYDGQGTRPEDEIKDRNGWDKIAAVENDQVFNIDSNIITRPGPRLAEAAKLIYQMVY